MEEIHLKTPEAIEKMRIAGRLAAEVLEMIEPHVKPGITTEALDAIAHEYMVEKQDAIPGSLNYHGFPKSMCTSVNHVICHGIPGPKVLKNGDIINIDVVVGKDGYFGDTSKMFFVGNKIPILAERLVKVTHECLWLGIDMIKPGVLLGDIGHVIQTHAEKHRFSVVREFCGHGIGQNMHEQPNILHYGKPGTGMALQAGMVFTIEPMINAGKRHIKTMPDKWTIITKDRSLSAQWEHTILVTDTGYEVLTLRDEER